MSWENVYFTQEKITQKVISCLRNPKSNYILIIWWLQSILFRYKPCWKRDIYTMWAQREDTNERALAAFAGTVQHCQLTGDVIQNKRLPFHREWEICEDTRWAELTATIDEKLTAVYRLCQLASLVRLFDSEESIVSFLVHLTSVFPVASRKISSFLKTYE